MSNKSPIFPIEEPQYFIDNYGFNSQIDYFQILKEARKHKKPIETSKKIKKQSHRKKWWKNENTNTGDLNSGTFSRRRAVSGGSIYGPLYITESSIGSNSPCRKNRRPAAGSLTPSKKGDSEIPYINLKEFNGDRQHRISMTSAAPIYLVT